MNKVNEQKLKLKYFIIKNQKHQIKLHNTKAQIVTRRIFVSILSKLNHSTHNVLSIIKFEQICTKIAAFQGKNH